MDALFGAAFDHTAVFVHEIAYDTAADGVFAILQYGVAFKDEDILLGKEGGLFCGALLSAILEAYVVLGDDAVEISGGVGGLGGAFLDGGALFPVAVLPLEDKGELVRPHLEFAAHGLHAAMEDDGLIVGAVLHVVGRHVDGEIGISAGQRSGPRRRREEKGGEKGEKIFFHVSWPP